MTSYPSYYDKYRKSAAQDAETPEKSTSPAKILTKLNNKKRVKTPSDSSDVPPPKRQDGGSFPKKNGGPFMKNRNQQPRAFQPPAPSQKTVFSDSPDEVEEDEIEGAEEVRSYVNRNRSGIKEWRLVVRNLPFKAKEADLRQIFAKHGQIKEIIVPACKDKKYKDSNAGFAFVQYSGKGSAERAISKLNFSQFMGRKIAVDYALDKDSYITKITEEKEKLKKIKKEEPEDEDLDESQAPVALPSPPVNKNTFEKPIKEELTDSEDEQETEDSEGDSSSSFDEEESLPSPLKTSKVLKPREKDLATQEGRVVFIRNLGFDTTNEDIKEAFSKFGEVTLAIACKFQHSDHSTGTAFVHFKEKDAADLCLDELNSMTGVEVDGRRVYGYRAVSREDAVGFKKDDKQPKDKRNLKLLRLSLVRPGSSKANEMSEFDSEKRKKLANSAKIKLKNLHNFVSPTRLAVHNIPNKMSEEKLRGLCFLACNNANAEIKECRIMKEKTGEMPNGKPIFGRSKGFAFIEFGDHKDALKCLETMNNDATMFSDEKRPIVEFSIENMNALKIKSSRNTKGPKAKKDVQDLFASKDLEETKRKIGALKPMPKKLGEKIRHRDSEPGKKLKKGKKKAQGNSKKAQGSSKRSMEARRLSKKKYVNGWNKSRKGNKMVID